MFTFQFHGCFDYCLVLLCDDRFIERNHVMFRCLCLGSKTDVTSFNYWLIELRLIYKVT
jgi:hypothetical protein